MTIALLLASICIGCIYLALGGIITILLYEDIDSLSDILITLLAWPLIVLVAFRQLQKQQEETNNDLGT